MKLSKIGQVFQNIDKILNLSEQKKRFKNALFALNQLEMENSIL
jgi:hypothetical protein